MSWTRLFVAAAFGVLFVTAHRPHDATSAMAVSADGRTVFARVRKQILRSSDGGKTWAWKGFGVYTPQYITTEQPEVRLFISPAYTADSTVFVHNIDGLYKSVDAGESWQLLRNSPVSVQPHDNLAFSHAYAQDGTFWVAGRLNSTVDVFASRDGGLTYSRLRCPVAPMTMIATPSGLLAAGSDGRLYASRNFTATWVMVSDLGFVARRMTETQATTPGTVRVMLGGITHVVHITLCRSSLLPNCGGVVSYTGNIRAFANPHNLTFSVGSHVGPAGESLYILPPASSYILRSVDGGATWQAQDHTYGVRGSALSSTDMDRENSKSWQCFGGAHGGRRVYLAGYGGVHISTDAGETWGQTNTIDSHWTHISSACMDRACSSWLLSACTYAAECYHVGVNKSAHNNMSARILFREETDSGGYGVTALSPNYRNDLIEFRAFKATLFRYTLGGGFMKSAAQARVFSAFDRTRDANIHTLHLSPGFGTANGVAFVAGFNLGARAWRTVDHGLTWHRLGPAVNGSARLSLSDRFDQDQTMASHLTETLRTENGAISWSTDGGAQWTQVTGTGAVGAWQDFRVFRGTHPIFPVVIGLRITSQARRPFITREGVWRELLPTRLWQPLRPTGFTEYAMFLAPTRTESSNRSLYLAYSTGGARIMTVSDRDETLLTDEEALPTPSVPNTRPGWTHTSMGPSASDTRSVQQRVVSSPAFLADGVLFAAAYYDIMVSRDRGRTWNTLLTLPNSLTDECTANCAFWLSCLECNPGYRRVATAVGALENDGVWNFVCNVSNASFHATPAVFRNTSTPISVNSSSTYVVFRSTPAPYVDPPDSTHSFTTETPMGTSPQSSKTYVETSPQPSETFFQSSPEPQDPPVSSSPPPSTTTLPPPPPPPSIAAGVPRTPRPPPPPPLSTLPPPPPPPPVVVPQTTPSGGSMWLDRPGINVPVYSMSTASLLTHNRLTVLAVGMFLCVHHLLYQ